MQDCVVVNIPTFLPPIMSREDVGSTLRRDMLNPPIFPDVPDNISQESHHSFTNHQKKLLLEYKNRSCTHEYCLLTMAKTKRLIRGTLTYPSIAISSIIMIINAIPSNNSIIRYVNIGLGIISGTLITISEKLELHQKETEYSSLATDFRKLIGRIEVDIISGQLQDPDEMIKEISIQYNALISKAPLYTRNLVLEARERVDNSGIDSAFLKQV